MLVPGGPSAQKPASGAPGPAAVRNTQVAAPRQAAGEPLPFVGKTTERFAVGAGALAVSQTCNQEFPGTRLCERRDIFRAMPPPALDGDVLVAPNYDVNPTTSCLSEDGRVRCRPGALIPAACCGTGGGVSGGVSIVLDLSSIVFATCADTWNLTATVVGASGNPITGALVSFSFQSNTPGGAAVRFSPGSATTDASGQAQTTVSVDPTSCVNTCAGGSSCGGTIIATDVGDQITSTPVVVNFAIP